MALILRVELTIARGQQAPSTAEQEIASYLQALGGADRLASISTFAIKGELSGNLSSFGRPFVPPARIKEHASFEFYFKAPNLRYGVQLRGNNEIMTVHGCDGSVAWYIGADAVRHESKPKDDNDNECQSGYEPIPVRIRAPGIHLQFKGKKKVAGRMTWAVRANLPKSSDTDTYYFDVETHLLVQWETIVPALFSGHDFKVERVYSDYREVNGIKVAFMIVQQSESSSLTTILREVEIDTPLDDALFREPSVMGGRRNPQIVLPVPAKSPEQHAELPPAGKPAPTDIPPVPAAPEPQEIPASGIVTTFVSFSLPELQQIVPELRGLKAAENQDELPALLDKIGNRIQELSQKVPNLVCREEIMESSPGSKTRRENFSYLILARPGRDAVVLEEFRIDLKTGVALESDAPHKPQEPQGIITAKQFDDLTRASQRINTRSTGGPPPSQGFASMWLRFYPSNRSESSFRYLGRQKIDRHSTLVVAFAQKPGSVRMPTEVRFQDKSVQIYHQGVAWVDESNYRILRLRTDLLSPSRDLPLTRLTSQVDFADTQAGGFSIPLWLPREVMVDSKVNGHTFHDKHTYSNYHSFQVKAKILLDP